MSDYKDDSVQERRLFSLLSFLLSDAAMGEKMEDATVKATPRASSSSHDAAAPAQHQQSNASASRPRSGSSETDLKDYVSAAAILRCLHDG